MQRKKLFPKSNETYSFSGALTRAFLLNKFNSSSTFENNDFQHHNNYYLYSIQSATNSDDYCQKLKIKRLDTIVLNKAIEICFQKDEDIYIAKCVDFPIHSYGDNLVEAIDNLRTNIEELIDDLKSSDDFSHKWLDVKATILHYI